MRGLTLPTPDKAVIYLDQFAISNLFKAKQRGDAGDYWSTLLEKVERAAALHQATFPRSSIHLDETIAFHSASDLQIFHETLGDNEFVSVADVCAEQEWQFFVCYLEGKPRPTLSFSVDNILRDERNKWLGSIHVTAETDWSVIAPMIRRDRDNGERAMQELAQRWRRTKPTFEEALTTEFQAYSEVRIRQLRDAADFDVFARFSAMRKEFEARGFEKIEAAKEVVKFFQWPEMEHHPEHRNSAYLFAALARQYASNRKKPPSGIMNDIKAVAAYGPYVDAMFIDNHCAALVREAKLDMKAEIFSKSSGDAFAEYIDGLNGRASPEMRLFAQQRFGIS
jgi:hypothetical protein